MQNLPFYSHRRLTVTIAGSLVGTCLGKVVE